MQLRPGGDDGIIAGQVLRPGGMQRDGVLVGELIERLDDIELGLGQLPDYAILEIIVQPLRLSGKNGDSTRYWTYCTIA